MYLMPQNRTLKMVKMVNFTSCIFYTIKKKVSRRKKSDRSTSRLKTAQTQASSVTVEDDGPVDSDKRSVSATRLAMSWNLNKEGGLPWWHSG